MPGSTSENYIAPLEVLVRTYEAGQAGITVNQAWKPRVLRRLASYVVDNLMENLAKSDGKWWARGDSNPGPPPCKGGVLTGLDDGPSSIGYMYFLINFSRQGIMVSNKSLLAPLSYEGFYVRNFRFVESSLKLLRRFYERLGWLDKVAETDYEFLRALEEASQAGVFPE